jgi:hypothetical protein
MKIDIGSGGFKREGFIGVDNVPSPDTDVVCNLEAEKLPFEDNSVSYIFSSHCLEHIRSEKLVPIFDEFSRVCQDGAAIEIWNPYAFHRDGYVLGHITFLTEEIYHHLCGLQDIWAPALGARWDLKEIRYHVPPNTLAEAAASAEFAVTHLNQVVKEFGVFIQVNKGQPASPHTPHRTLVDEAQPLPMRSTRELNLRPLAAQPAPVASQEASELTKLCRELALESNITIGLRREVALQKDEIMRLCRELGSWHQTCRRLASLTARRLRLTRALSEGQKTEVSH